jgi:hypothetical protein
VNSNVDRWSIPGSVGHVLLDRGRIASHGKQHIAGRFIAPASIVFHVAEAHDQGRIVEVVPDVFEQGTKGSYLLLTWVSPYATTTSLIAPSSRADWVSFRTRAKAPGR